MILVDTSVWIDHLHRANPRLNELLARDEVGSHPLVIEELALGSLRQRGDLLQWLANLDQFPVLAHHELLTLVERWTLWGRGLSASDAHLLGSALLRPGSQLWTRDKRLARACEDAGVGVL